MNYLLRTLAIVIMYNLSFQTVAADENTVIYINAKNMPIENLLKEFEKQSEMHFTYESSLLKGVGKITFQANGERLKECLDKLFEKLPLTFSIHGNFIILKRKTQKVTINGFVRSKRTHEPLPVASVLVQNTRQGVATNQNGFFSLSVTEGDIPLEVSYIGFRRYRQTLRSLQRDTIVEIYLEESGQLAEVIIMGNQTNQNPVFNSQMGTLKVSQATIKSIPTLFGEADITKTLQMLPGVSAGIEGLSGLYVRGGNGDENLYRIDGIPVYQVNHLGGLFSSFNPEAIREMEFYKAAFPARYGGKLSSVIDIRTKEGNFQEYHGSATLGLTSGNLHLEGPIVKEKSSFNVSLRRSWLDVFSAPAVAILNAIDKKNGYKTVARYAFNDVNLKLVQHVNERSDVYLNLYYGDDFLKFGEKEFNVSLDVTPYEYKDYKKLRWGNLIVSPGLNYRFSEKLRGDVNIAYVRYKTSLKNKIDDYYGAKGTEEYEEFSSETLTRNAIHDFSFRSSFLYTPTHSHHLRFGAEYSYHRFLPEYSRMKSTEDISYPDQLFKNEKLSANEVALFLEDDWSIGKWIRLNAGIRFSLFNIEKKTYPAVEPRLSTRFLITDQLSIKASYARMKQFIHQMTESHINLPTDMWLPVNENFKPLVSDQISVGTYYTLQENYSFGVEGYYKWMNNILDYKDGYNFLPSLVGWQEKLTAGKGKSYGLEFLARKEKGKMTGWMGYGLMWTDREFKEINDGKRFPAKYDNRHKVNLVANWKVKENMELTGSWIYMTGNRITLSLNDYWNMNEGVIPDRDKPLGSGSMPIEYYEERNNIRLPDYHRLDLGINLYRPKKNGRMGIWNISIYNVYCRMNPITIQRDYSNKVKVDERYVPVFKTMGFMPIIPSVSYTYKF